MERLGDFRLLDAGTGGQLPFRSVRNPQKPWLSRLGCQATAGLVQDSQGRSPGGSRGKLAPAPHCLFSAGSGGGVYLKGAGQPMRGKGLSMWAACLHQTFPKRFNPAGSGQEANPGAGSTCAASRCLPGRPPEGWAPGPFLEGADQGRESTGLAAPNERVRGIPPWKTHLAETTVPPR
ncbi:unnamed protein product [Lepidochelys kempii]